MNRYVGADLRGHQTGMSQQGLNVARVGPHFVHERGYTVA